MKERISLSSSLYFYSCKNSVTLVMSLIVGSSRDGSNTLGILKKFVLMTNKKERKESKRKKKIPISGCQIGKKKKQLKGYLV